MAGATSIGRVLLKVGGCGLSFEIEFESSTTVATVLDVVAEKADVAPSHIKLLNRGKVLAGGTLEAAGVRDRTKLMLVHTPDYHRDAKALEQIRTIRQKVDGDLNDELLTQLLCQLDAVDVTASDWLRQRRKQVISHIHGLSSQEASS